MKWATRTRIHIDRAACAWLIRRHSTRTPSSSSSPISPK
ncbi:chromate resistance protein ChrB domain-containing protein [Streptomyces bathyalis]